MDLFFSRKSTIVNQEGIVIWIHLLRWNVLDRRVCPAKRQDFGSFKVSAVLSKLFRLGESRSHRFALVFAVISYKDERIARATVQRKPIKRRPCF